MLPASLQTAVSLQPGGLTVLTYPLLAYSQLSDQVGKHRLFITIGGEDIN